MLFFISEEIANKADNCDKAIINSLYSLGYFWRTGFCLVDGSRSTLLKLASIKSLKDDYELILDQKQSVAGLYKEIDFFVVLCNSDSGVSKIIDGAIGKPINIRYFDNRIKFGLNIVLCENIRDYDLYKWGVLYFGEIDETIFRIQALGYNGGGSVIVESAKHISDFPCLIICDNDKKFPEDDGGDTLNDLRNYYAAERPMLTWKYEINVHEIENLIPFDLMCKVCGTNGLLKKMRSVKNSPDYGIFFSFFDFKEGFKKCTLREMKNGNVESFNNYLSFLRTIGVRQDKIDKTLTSKFKKNESPLLPGVSGDLLKKVVESVSCHDLNHSIKLDNYQMEDWRNIIRKMWSIGCANNPRRV